MFIFAVNRARSVLTIALALLFITNLGLKIAWIDLITQYLVLMVVFFSLLSVRGVSRIIGFTIYLVGIALLLHAHAPSSVWIDGVNRNTYMLVMFALTPLLSIPLTQGGYSEALEHFLIKYLNRKSLFTVFISSLCFFTSTILNVAAVNLVYQIGSRQTYQLDRRLLVTSIARGYSAALTWGPTFAAVALPLELTGVKWLDFFPYAFSIGILVLFMIWIIAFVQEYQEKKQTAITSCLANFDQSYSTELKSNINPGQIKLLSQDKKKLYELIFFWFLIFGLIIFISWAIHVNTINIVSIVALLIPPLWLLLIKRVHLYWPNVRGYFFKEALPRMSPEVVLFSGAGFMASAIDYSGAANWIPNFIDAITIQGSTLSFIAVALGLIMGLSIFGVHAMISVVIIGGAIDPALYGISSLVMCLILATGWGLSLSVSNSATINIMLAGIIQKDPITVSLFWNYRYALLTFLLATLLLQGLTMLGI